MKTFLLSAFALAMGLTGAQAVQYKALHSFCTKTKCSDGALPFGAPVTDGRGNWYGATTRGGGRQQTGAIYRMSFGGKHWQYSRIHYFCAKHDCIDGATPYGSLIIDTAGNLYGTASFGGAGGKGVVFELALKGGKWAYRVLHDFCVQGGCSDGAQPFYAGLSYQGQESGALYDGVSPLYGVTELGGANSDGTVFALTGKGPKRSFQVLYSFCAQANCADGAFPYGGVTVGADGNTLYGTTNDGGSSDSGTVYKLTRRGGGSWAYHRLHDFCRTGSIPCTDGSFPQSKLALDAQGNLYGTTENGGDDSFGTVFEIDAGGRYTRLHSFCADPDCPDGSLPYAGVTIDGAGRLVGGTFQGGTDQEGVIFALGGAGHTTFEKLVEFHATAKIKGGKPYSPPVMGPGGDMYGVTFYSGDGDNGVFYKLTP